MKIRTKILGLTIAPIAGMMVMLVVGRSGMKSIDASMQSLVQNDVSTILDQKIPDLEAKHNSIELMLNADRDAYQALVAEFNALTAGSEKQYQDSVKDNETNLKQVQSRLEEAAAALDPTMKPTYQATVSAYEVWSAQTRAAIVEARDPAARGRLMASAPERVETFQAMRDLIDQLQIDTEQRIADGQAGLIEDKDNAFAQADAVSARATSTIGLFLAVAAASGLLVAGLCLFVARTITKPMAQIVDRLKNIAEGEGDLTQRIDDNRKDELGDIATLFNTFIEKVHEVVLGVDLASSEVASASTQIAASAEEMAQTMDHQTRQVRDISTAVEQMATNVVDIAQQAAEAAQTADQSGQSARKGGEVVGMTVQGMRNIADAVSASSRSVQELGQRGEQIGQVITVINDIADQTNLLALNAAIEAARAGEHGRGFAVVADEVRKLADRTTKATEEIAGSIQAIQVETTEAVKRMETGTTQVNEGVEQAQIAGQSLSEIVASAGQVTDMIRSIATSTERQSAASEQIGRAVQEIAAASSEASQGASQAATAVSALSQKAEELQFLVSQFKLDRSRA